MDMSVKLNLSYPAPKPATTVTDKPPEAPQAAPQVASVADPAADKSQGSDDDKLKLAVQEIEKFVQSIKRNLEFSIDEHSGKVIVKVIASETGEVVRQIPSAEALKLADSLSNASHVLFDAKV
ncbi:flagellar protein FlaG [Pseudomonas gingeri]|uniref:Flagellar protein FlaG n=1 Tax=Pseudomonas gingeri TaxID=117681 RepID=A0A7Y7YHR5_9PSED|nr:flagellar protein FlaG [Pseudomonas gingeri]NWA00914.1 flagellar protein FlaG [Pseudomonas gingeri]NWA16042.1 flagellar protein FlaG [Pseudomonas gingeri]NWA54232.1 flagellar protein FlaG [Pseudomonas gingeri]NWA97691.1 flagellar protein FlaG [Pseudomonas gingeri]NWB04497.1 flagellar protein FlaG [Pseudomonas gingeri]